MPGVDLSLTWPRLDATVVLESKELAGDEGKPALERPLFALVSLNDQTAPSAEVPWSQLFALSLRDKVEEPRVLSVGRHKDCEIRLADPRVSLMHFEITARRKFVDRVDMPGQLAYECALRDGSSNGTTINGRPVGKGNSSLLRSGDEICVLPAHRVGKDSMIAFLFRNMTEAFESPKEVRSLDLDELVLCPICMQPIYKCVALLPCLHNFCMACYSEWMLRKEDCPVCRREVNCVVKNHPMEAIVEAFLEACPERRRTAEEIEDMDARDHLKLGAGGKIVRNHCSVSISASHPLAVAESPPPPPAALSPQVDGAVATVGPPPEASSANIASSIAAQPRAREVAGGSRVASAREGLTTREPTTRASSGPGSQVCVLQ
eukprot:TRINITY_DN5829_c0_g1_i2.p1 TRINITY_DN5829_c0_g1~~TRINITY_DN5829_c0_g1_i2.p1  ORF type:complete len:377 (+),score=65.54 TRINITY_DN5829_c0_g1_i2:129-1259(+)